ncbi:peroxiredoxin [Magnetospirillum sp. UT-4]|uniref:peroxiredoxin n=1 Tax=Magnetospirillum sp. UT-4 TaxID=2681467 RepID=UPI001383174A|nr:peroxiredoxin [Magnetospirillum sp. UT-4]CAA7613651.1 putative Peroxiredoxin [Magnetospirillum sp. UT-4]
MRIPRVVFKTRVRNEALGGSNPYEWRDLSTDEVFGGRKVVMFALPGAFTPTCSSNHLPRYEAEYDQFRALGVDEVACLAVNDAFVMNRWARDQGVEKVLMLPDGNGEFTRKMGMLVDKSNLGFGMRSWRYSLYAEDCEVKVLLAEPGYEDNCPRDPFEVSDSDTMLDWLRQNRPAPTPSAA